MLSWLQFTNMFDMLDIKKRSGKHRDIEREKTDETQHMPGLEIESWLYRKTQYYILLNYEKLCTDTILDINPKRIIID